MLFQLQRVWVTKVLCVLWSLDFEKKSSPKIGINIIQNVKLLVWLQLLFEKNVHVIDTVMLLAYNIKVVHQIIQKKWKLKCGAKEWNPMKCTISRKFEYDVTNW